MSLGEAKHETGNTLGTHPEVYPFLMEHIGETNAQKDLRDAIVKKERARMMGSPDEAQFLAWLIGLTNAKKIIEVGVFRGSTTLAMAQVLPEDGKIIGLDVSEEFTKMGIEAWHAAGVSNKIDLRIAPAKESMEAMVTTEGELNSYDMCFIDADKVGYDDYYELALKLVKPNGIIAVDNTLWHGNVAKPPASEDDRAILDICAKIKADKRVQSVMLGIADGVYMCRKL